MVKTRLRLLSINIDRKGKFNSIQGHFFYRKNPVVMQAPYFRYLDRLFDAKYWRLNVPANTGRYPVTHGRRMTWHTWTQLRRINSKPTPSTRTKTQ